jgi:tetratricopeptide (TPR) repeat protein
MRQMNGLVGALLAGPVGLALALAGGPAAADMIEDCTSGGDVQRKIDGCTAMIEAGNWSGSELAVVYAHRCVAHQATGQSELAFADCDQVVSLAPDAAYAYVGRGNAHAALGQLELAVLDYDEAISRDAGNVLAYFNRASAHSQLGQHEQSIEDFDQLLALDGLNDAQLADIRDRRAFALNWFAWELYTSGRAADGLPLVEEALTVKPEDAGFIDTRASILCALERKPDALDDFAQVIQAGGGDWARHYQQTLTELGYRPGPVDGQWGTNSQNALDEWVQGGCPPPTE